MRLFLTTTLLALVVSLPSFAQNKFLVEEVIAVVGSTPVMYSQLESMTTQIIEDRKQNGTKTTQDPRDQAFEALLLQRLLYTQAKLDSLDKDSKPLDEAIQAEVQRQTLEAGSIRALEKRYGKPIFQIKADMQREVELTQLSQQMEQKVRGKVTITYPEVEAFFKSIPTDSLPLIPQQCSYSQIVKMPPATDERKFEIRERLLGYRQRVMDGEKLAVLARAYSMDGSASRGGEMTQVLQGLVAPFADAIRQLKPGQISEIVETEYGYHIIELIDLKDDVAHFRHLLLKPQFTVAETAQVNRELDSLVKLITDKKATFEEVVVRHSDDADTRQNKGVAFNSQAYMQTGDPRMATIYYMMDELQPDEYRIIRDMKPGDLSPAFQTIDKKGNIVYKIVRLEKIIPAHPANMELDYDILEVIALRDKQARTIDKWIDEKIKSIDIEINPSMHDVKFDRQGWVK